MKGQIWKNVIQTLVAIGLLLVIWIIAYVSVGNELLVPSFLSSGKELFKLFGKAYFWRGVWGSFLRAFLAFSIAFVVAFVFAVIAYMVPSFERVFAPIVSAFRSIPVLAVLLILLTFLSAWTAPIAVAFLSLFPMLYTGILSAFSGIDKTLLEEADVSGASLFRRIFGVYLPLSSPYIVREAGAGLSFSVKLIVSAEILSNTARSLGGLMQEARVYLNLPQLFALVVSSFLLGLLVELLFSWLAVAVEKRVK